MKSKNKTPEGEFDLTTPASILSFTDKLGQCETYEDVESLFHALPDEVKRMLRESKVLDMLESSDKKTILIALDNYKSESLQSFRDIDCFVSTSCPRIAIDDYLQYKKPIITPIELEIVLGKRKWEDYLFDQIIND